MMVRAAGAVEIVELSLLIRRRMPSTPPVSGVHPTPETPVLLSEPRTVVTKMVFY
jgi:hypothetical protein